MLYSATPAALYAAKGLMPLIPQSKVRSKDCKQRVTILHDTIKQFETNGTRLRADAMSNLEHWTAQSISIQQKPCSVHVSVIQGDVLEATYKLTKTTGTIVAAINMANEIYPGGGYLTGCTAQEENMARRTDLHFLFDESAILPVKRKKKGAAIDYVYTDAMSGLVSGMTGAVYLSPFPLICIKGREVWNRGSVEGYEPLNASEVFPFLELRTAAVDTHYVDDDDETIILNMQTRIRAQFLTLKERGVRHVVLSAFGCGAFGNDAHSVACLYKKALAEFAKDFDEVVFAIYYAGHGENNFDVFRAVLLGEPATDSSVGIGVTSSGNRKRKADS